MTEGSSLKTSIVLVVSLALGALVSAQVKHLRESEAFYRWMIAAATEERLFNDWGQDFEDQALFIETQIHAEPLLANESSAMTVDDGRVIGKIAALCSDVANNDLLFKVARSSELAATRTQFLQKARDRKLQFAKYEGYIENVHIFNLFFGFRKVAANFVWLQVDRYWHQGLMYRMVPLMKTCVTLDPNFVDAYLLGAWHLSYNATAKMPDTPMPLRDWYPQYGEHGKCLGEKELYYYLAKDFLEDGIRNNLREYKLNFDLGFGIYSRKLKDYKNAVKYLTEAVRQPHEVWVPRQLYINMELNGQYEEALAGWEDYIERYPRTMSSIDVAPRKIQRNRAHIHERNAEEALAAAESATDPAEAAAQRDKAKAERESARQIWDAMDEPYGTARSLRLQALDYVEDGRYLEAFALLDQARYESPSQFDEYSELIVEIKHKGDLPLTLSEKKWEKRQEEGDICRGMPTAAEEPA